LTEPGSDGIVRRAGWPDVDDPRMRIFLRHWAEARQGGIVPKRSAIDPAAIAPCLPNIFMYRYVPEGRDFRLAIGGEEIRSFWRVPIVGKSMREVLGGPRGELAIARGLLVVDTPGLLFTKASRITRPDATFAVTRLTSPLAKEDGSIFGTIGISIYVAVPPGSIPSESTSLHDCAGLPAAPP
jgi:hypothetical protein